MSAIVRGNRGVRADITGAIKGFHMVPRACHLEFDILASFHLWGWGWGGRGCFSRLCPATVRQAEKNVVVMAHLVVIAIPANISPDPLSS